MKKENNKSIHKGALSSGIVQETGGKVSGIGRKMSRSNLGEMLGRFENNTRRMVNETLSKKRNNEVC